MGIKFIIKFICIQIIKMAWDKADDMKLIFNFLIFFEAFIMGMIPVCSKKFTESPKVLGIANSFSAGIFIAIALMHIMPEEAEKWEEYKKDNHIELGLPVPFLIMLSGYTLILLIDKVLFDTHGFEDHSHEHGHLNLDA